MGLDAESSGHVFANRSIGGGWAVIHQTVPDGPFCVEFEELRPISQAWKAFTETLFTGFVAFQGGRCERLLPLVFWSF